MAKRSNKSKQVEGDSTSAPTSEAKNANGASTPAAPAEVSAKIAQPKRAAKTKPAAKTREKVSRPRKPRTTAASRKPVADNKPEPSDDEIRIRAYFISQDRIREGRPGSSADDWLEARRQLEAEANADA
jgi:hypothetical protein